MKKVNIILILLFILPVFACGNSGASLEDADTSSSNDKDIVIENLQILDMPSSSQFTWSDKWEPVKIPLVYKFSDRKYTDDNSFWIRGEFSIKNYTYRISEYYGINLGLVACFNYVYINGQLAGKAEYDDLDKFLRPKSYILPDDLKLNEWNEVYIRITPVDCRYLTLLSDIKIQNKKEYLRSQRRVQFLFSQLPVGFSILLIGIIVILLKNFILYRNIRYLLYTGCLFFFLLSLSVFLNYFHVYIYKSDILLAVIYGLYPVYIYLFFLILQSFNETYFFKLNIISAFVIILVSIYIFSGIYRQNDTAISIKSLMFLIIPVLIYQAYLVYLSNSIKQDKFKFRLMILFLAAINIICIIQGIGMIYNIWYRYFYEVYSTSVIVLFVIINENREAKKRRIETEKIYNSLKKNHNHDLTDSAEQKITRVVGYINENYQSDISREGLACAVDMNPNYMSGLFCRHTGKKINEYINHLRITDAVLQLKDSNNNKKIIDVALMTGFESLSTFNRAFKNETGVTPTEFKKNKESINIKMQT